MMGRGVLGTVTEVAADHYTIKTDAGLTYTIHYSANTRIVKQPPGTARSGARCWWRRRPGWRTISWRGRRQSAPGHQAYRH
jgi:hypothetical protein